MDPAPNSNRIFIRSTAAGVVLSAITAASTFTSFAPEFAFLRYPLLAAAMVTVLLAGWSTGRLPAFNRTLWAHAPWWARLSWLAIISGALAAFASITVAQTMPRDSEVQDALETRGIAAIAAYLLLVAALRRNVDERLADDDPFEHPANVGDARDTGKRRSRKENG